MFEPLYKKVTGTGEANFDGFPQRPQETDLAPYTQGVPGPGVRLGGMSFIEIMASVALALIIVMVGLNLFTPNTTTTNLSQENVALELELGGGTNDFPLNQKLLKDSIFRKIPYDKGLGRYEVFHLINYTKLMSSELGTDFSGKFLENLKRSMALHNFQNDTKIIRDVRNAIKYKGKRQKNKKRDELKPFYRYYEWINAEGTSVQLTKPRLDFLKRLVIVLETAYGQELLLSEIPQLKETKIQYFAGKHTSLITLLEIEKFLKAELANGRYPLDCIKDMSRVGEISKKLTPIHIQTWYLKDKPLQYQLYEILELVDKGVKIRNFGAESIKFANCIIEAMQGGKFNEMVLDPDDGTKQ